MTVHDDPPPAPPLQLAEPPYDPYDESVGRTPVHAPDAEQALLSVLLNYPELAPEIRTHLEDDDLYLSRNETIWHAIHAVAATGLAPDLVAVHDHLRRHHQLERAGGIGYLHTLLASAASPTQAGFYAQVIRDHARLRAVHALGPRFATISDPTEIDDLLQRSYEALDYVTARTGPTRTITRHVQNIDELLAGEDEDTYDWVIPGLLEHQDRVILTAAEGSGKSTLMRQIGIQAAAGIHPFTGEAIDPVNVLHIDVENTLRQSRRRYRPLRLQAGNLLDPERLHVEIRVAGLDLTQPEDRDWLSATCLHVQPDLLLIGPVYKLANGDPTEEKSAKPVAMALDAIRELTDTALILEAHAPKAPSGQRKRPREPYGWSGWMRWPEFGLWLDENGDLEHWRGDREERAWPHKLERGGDWPWSPALTDSDQKWIAIRKARLDAGRKLSFDDLSKATGMSKTTIARLVGKGAPFDYAWTGFNASRHHSDQVSR